MSAVFAVLYFVTMIYLILLIMRMIIGLIQSFSRDWTPRGLVLVGCETVYTATDQPLRALRRRIRPLRLGPISLDLSFMIVFFAVMILNNIFRGLAT